jgi:hypothetical protein
VRCAWASSVSTNRLPFHGGRRFGGACPGITPQASLRSGCRDPTPTTHQTTPTSMAFWSRSHSGRERLRCVLAFAFGGRIGIRNAFRSIRSSGSGRGLIQGENTSSGSSLCNLGGRIGFENAFEWSVPRVRGSSRREFGWDFLRSKVQNSTQYVYLRIMPHEQV